MPIEPPTGMTFQQWADSLGLPPSTLRDRIRRGLPIDAPKVSHRERGLRCMNVRHKPLTLHIKAAPRSEWQNPLALLVVRS